MTETGRRGSPQYKPSRSLADDLLTYYSGLEGGDKGEGPTEVSEWIPSQSPTVTETEVKGENRRLWEGKCACRVRVFWFSECREDVTILQEGRQTGVRE